MIRPNRFSAAALGFLLAAAACQNDEVNRPFSNIPVDPLFDRYVSMGNSITAGFQSGGINDSTQRQSYAVLLAQAMHSPSFLPLLSRPGCPPPYTNVFTQTRLPSPPGYPVSSGTTCFLRSVGAVRPPYMSNTAVPGAEVIDIYNNFDATSNANTLTQFILGGLTQVGMVKKAQPTFVSLWIGNNDVLGAATNLANAGDSTRITPVATFQANYDAVLDSIEDVSPQGAALVGVANVTRIPFFSRGTTYFAIKAGLVPGAAFPPNFVVAVNCAPPRGDSVLVPFPYGLPKIDSALGNPAGTYTLDCAVPQVVVPEELVRLVSAVAGYNTHISAAATARGWAYFDPNPVFDSVALAGAIPAFPFARNAAGGINPCAGTPASAGPPPLPATPPPFGLLFSCDGVHPSGATHRLIATKLRDAINAAYGTAIPPIP
jgi:lysophospholipase L1-like esterase